MTAPAPARERLREAGRRIFLERGFARASVRDIAAAAQADPALVIRYFGSKEGLFLDALRVEFELSPLLEGPVEGLGARIVEAVLADEDDIRGVFLALIRASEVGDVSSRLRAAHEETFVAPLRARLDGPDADLRARMAAALVGGLLYSAWIVGDEPLRAGGDLVVREYGAALQRLLTPPR
ncbi:MAG: TetR family transcriptional regulator [Actinomycetales bacterium]|nr:TetR family transcriptional regulator [Actinomycetales bacterium]